MSGTFSEWMNGSVRSLSLRGTLTFTDGESAALSPGDLLSASVSEGAADGLLLGSVLTNACTARLSNEGGIWLPGGAKRGQRPLIGAAVMLELGVKNGTETAYSPLCSFIVKSASAPQRGAVTLRGSGGLPGGFDEPFLDGLSYPLSLGALVAALVAAGGGVLLNADFPGGALTVASAPAWEGRTVRQALSCALTAAGCFMFCDASGALSVRRARDTSAAKNVPPACTISLLAPEPAFGPLAALRVGFRDRTECMFVNENAVSARHNTFSIEENPLFPKNTVQTETLGRALLASLSGLELPEGQIVFTGDPAILLGDTLRVTDRAGNEFLLPVTFRSLLVRGGAFSMTASCTASVSDALVLSDGVVSAARLKGQADGSLIKAGTLTARALAAGTITSQYLASSAVTAEKLAADCVTAGKIAAASVSSEKIASGAVTAEKLASASITADKLAASSVTAEKIAAGAVTAGAVAAASLTADRLAAGTITAQSGVLANACVSGAQIADLSVTDGKIVSLTASKLTAGTIDASLINVENLRADNITAGTLNGAVIPVLSGEKLSAGAVTGEKLADGAVAADKLVAGAVTADKLAAFSVTAEKILAGAVTAEKLAASSVTADKISAGSITAACLSADAGQGLDLSSNTSVVARVLENSSVTINQDGIGLTGAAVDLNTDSFNVTALKNGERVMRLTPDGLEARLVCADTVLSPTVLGVYAGDGAAVFSGSIQASLNNLPRYLPFDVTLTVPDGTYPERPVISGFSGPGRLTVLMTASALVFGGFCIERNQCPVTISGGVICGENDYCVSAEDNLSLTLYAVTLFGAFRSSADDADRTLVGFLAKGGFSCLSDVVINRVDTCVSALMGARVCLQNASGGMQRGFTAVCTATNYGYLRDNPSANYTKLANVPSGAALTMTTDELFNGAYYQVTYEGQTGYLSQSVVGEIQLASGTYASNANLGHSFFAASLGRISCTGTRPLAALGLFDGTQGEAGDGEVFCTAEAAPSDALAPITPGTQLEYASNGYCGMCTPLDSKPMTYQKPKQGSYKGLVPYEVNNACCYRRETIYCKGAWFLKNADEIAGKAILGATVTLRRAASGGDAGKKTVYLYGHTIMFNPRTEVLTEFPECFPLNVSVELDLDEEATVALPAAAVQMLSAGTLLGFALSTEGDYVAMTTELTLRMI